MRLTIEKILSIPKSLYCSLRLFPFLDALKLPIFVRYNTRIKGLNGHIEILKGEARFGMFQVGFGDICLFDKKYVRSMLNINGTIKLSGKVFFGQGARIDVGHEGMLEIGANFVNTATGALLCQKHIFLGDNVTLSWNSVIMDSDFHRFILIGEGNKMTAKSKDILIGDNVFIGMRSCILKGSSIYNGCVIGAGTVVSGKFEEANTCIVSNQSYVKMTGITMERD